MIHAQNLSCEFEANADEQGADAQLVTGELYIENIQARNGCHAHLTAAGMHYASETLNKVV